MNSQLQGKVRQSSYLKKNFNCDNTCLGPSHSRSYFTS